MSSDRVWQIDGGAVGSIEFAGIKRSRPHLSFVRHAVDRWIARRRALYFLPHAGEYRVVVSRLGGEGDAAIECGIEVRIGAQVWTAHEVGTSLAESVGRALDQLAPRIRAEASPYPAPSQRQGVA